MAGYGWLRDRGAGFEILRVTFFERQPSLVEGLKLRGREPAITTTYSRIPQEFRSLLTAMQRLYLYYRY